MFYGVTMMFSKIYEDRLIFLNIFSLISKHVTTQACFSHNPILSEHF